MSHNLSIFAKLQINDKNAYICEINHLDMKKLITLILMFALAAPVFAQENEEQKWTFRGSAGYLPSVPVLVSVFGAIVVGIAVGANEDNNEDLDIDIPPFYSIEALYSFNARWSVGISTGYTGCVWNIVDKDTRDVHSSSVHSFVPINAIGRCNYLNRPKVKLYGSLEAGVLLSAGESLGIAPDVQLNPIGVEFGSRVFGMAELGVGMNYTGLRLGLGFRF